MPSKTGALNRCTVCEITFPAVKKLNHLRDYHLATQSIKCSRCDFINSVAEVNKHIREEHSDALTSIICFIVDANQNGATILRKVQPMVDLRQKAPSGTVGSKPSHPKAPAPGKAVAPLLEKLNSSIVVDAGPRNWKERPLSANQAAALRQSQHDANWKPMTTTITEIKCPKVNKASVKRLPKIQADDERRRYFDFENVDRMKAVSEEFFCIVDNCTETFLFADIEKGIRHLKQHLSYGMHCRKCNMLDASALFSNEDDDDKASRLALREHYSKMHPSIDPLKMWDDDNHRPDIGNWIGIFFNRQFKYAREQNKHPPLKSDSPKNPLVYITCPLCEKASKILNADENLGMVPRKFSNMIEFENHYWTHTSYYKRQCKICLKRFADDKAKALDHASRSHRDVFANYNYEDFFPVVRDLCLDKIIEDSIERKKMEFYQALMQSYGVTADFNLYVCIAGKERDLANKGLDGPVDLSGLDANLDPIRVEPLPSTSVEFDSPEPEVAELLDQDEEVLLLPPVKAPTPTIFDVSSDDDEGEKNIPPASLDDKKSLDLEAALARLHGDL
ncbi:hypothetical protein HDE_06320 [Halotydeus destructor]|nr:hypothetical protein HDE_06320 [Halotydeus destructor]